MFEERDLVAFEVMITKGGERVRISVCIVANTSDKPNIHAKSIKIGYKHI